jgi:hypothetical protein
LYLVIIILGALGEAMVRGSIVVPGDATATAANLREARPGYEPEAEYATAYSFTEVGWFDLRHPAGWNEQVVHDPITFSLLQRLQAALGYMVADMS